MDESPQGKIYATQPTSIADLNERKTIEKRKISPQTLNNVRDEFYRTLCYCRKLGGEHLEQYFRHFNFRRIINLNL